MYNRAKPPYDPIEARAILRRARVTQTELARRLGIYPSAISNVLDGYSQSQRVWNEIKRLDKEFPKPSNSAA